MIKQACLWWCRAAFSLLIALLASQPATTQAIRLDNITSHDPLDKQLYLGIINKIHVQPSRAIDSVYSTGCTVQLQGDTILLQPQAAGEVLLHCVTRGGLVTYQFTATHLPELKLYLDGHPPGVIFLSRFRSGQTMKVQSDGKDFWSNVHVVRFAIAVNNQPMVNEGAIISSSLAELIKRSAPGSHIQLTSAELMHNTTGRRRTVPVHQTFLVQ